MQIAINFLKSLFDCIMSSFVPLNVLLLCCQVVIHTIRLPKQSTVGDVISDLKTKVILLLLSSQMDVCFDYNWKCVN